MAAHIFQNNHEISKQEIQTALAKAVELRTLHATLLHGNSPASTRFPTSASPSIPCSSNLYSAQDYPVFMPSYEDELLSGFHQIHSENRRISETSGGIGLETGGEDDEADLSDNRKLSTAWRKGSSFGLIGREQNMWTEENHKLNRTSCVNHINVLQTSPGTEISKSSRRFGLGEFKTVSTCNTCKPAVISREIDIDSKNSKNSNRRVPVTDSHALPHSHPKNKGPTFSWFFPRSKKKPPKAEMSPNKAESENASHFLREWVSIETLKRQLLEANENRDAALTEAAEMKSSMAELKQKLLHLEMYCDELNKALKQAVQGREIKLVERPNLLRRGKSLDITRDSSMPLDHEAMVEGFLQIVSEARLSVKHFCKALISQMEETDDSLMEKLNSILHPHNLFKYSKNSKGVFYHLESLINQSLHQDFENCIFQKNGPQKSLDPEEARREMFSAFVALRNLSWNEVLRKGTKYYSEEFSRFCDQKMGCIVSTLNWLRPWPEQLLQSFFVAAKCIWLLHLLAFSFRPPLVILRVDENRSFDPLYMEDILSERPRSRAAARVKIMVMPGFYIDDKVLRCKVLCR
ncbi:hypothetical protein AAC387_Pa02g3034 [Persea americana]